MTNEENERSLKPKDFNTGADKETPKPAPESALSRFIGDKGFNMVEKKLEGPEKEQGVTLDTSRGGESVLIFDEETINRNEKAKIESFVRAVRSGGKDALKGTPFEWFFGEEDDKFIGDLADLLEQRLEELNNNLTSTSLTGLGLDDKLVSAFQSFRESAKREQVRKGFERQVQKLPLLGFEGRDKQGNIVSLRFNPKNAFDPSNEVEFIYINNPSGQPELIISCKDPDKYDVIRPIIQNEDEANSQGKFDLIETSFASVPETDPRSGKDLSRFEFDIVQGFSDVTPMFTKVRVLKKPIDMDRELDAYVEKQRLEEEQKRLAANQRRAAQAYQSTPPTPAPSSSQYRWEQPPTTYVRSG
jgi:hypothetical protein